MSIEETFHEFILTYCLVNVSTYRQLKEVTWIHIFCLTFTLRYSEPVLLSLEIEDDVVDRSQVGLTLPGQEATTSSLNQLIKKILYLCHSV